MMRSEISEEIVSDMYISEIALTRGANTHDKADSNDRMKKHKDFSKYVEELKSGRLMLPAHAAGTSWRTNSISTPANMPRWSLSSLRAYKR